MRLFKAEMVERLTRLNVPDDVPIETKMVTRAIASAQSQVEQQNFEIRKNVLKYDEVLNRQREVIYGERRKVLEGEDLHEQIAALHRRHDRPRTSTRETAEGFAGGVGPGPAVDRVQAALPGDGDRRGARGGRRRPGRAHRRVHRRASQGRRAGRRTTQREEELGAEVMRELERRVVLSVLDRKWREHLYEMDYLQEGIGLRAMAQRDPLVEYQREGFDMFTAMMDGIKEESVGYLFNLEVQVDAAAGDADDSEPPSAPSSSTRATPTRCRSRRVAPR